MVGESELIYLPDIGLHPRGDNLFNEHIHLNKLHPRTTNTFNEHIDLCTKIFFQIVKNNKIGHTVISHNVVLIKDYASLERLLKLLEKNGFINKYCSEYDKFYSSSPSKYHDGSESFFRIIINLMSENNMSESNTNECLEDRREFYNSQITSIQHTKSLISRNHAHYYEKKLILDNNYFANRIALLQYINDNDIGNIIIKKQEYLQFCCCVRYYFPKVIIILGIQEELNKNNILDLNYVSTVIMNNEDWLEPLRKLVYVNEPIFLTI